MTQFVFSHLDAKLTWASLAAAVGLKRFAFGRHFKLFTGMTPHQYVIHCRLNEAVKLLSHSKLSLAEIALQVGCSSQSHLTTLFRKHLHTTPGTYRLAAANGGVDLRPTHTVSRFAR